MSEKRPITPEDDPKDPDRPGKAVWDTRDRLEAAEREIARLRRLLLDHGITDPLGAGGYPVKLT